MTLANKLGITSHDGFISIESSILYKCAMTAYQVCKNIYFIDLTLKYFV